jgi:hypothetical protein
VRDLFGNKIEAVFLPLQGVDKPKTKPAAQGKAKPVKKASAKGPPAAKKTAARKPAGRKARARRAPTVRRKKR